MKDLVNDGFAQVVKPYIDAQDTKTRKMLAPVEPDETDASQAYEIGDQLILDGILYDVIAAIAQHGIITATGSGANIAVAGDLSGQFATLKETLTDEVETRATLGAHNLVNTKFESPIVVQDTLTFTLQNDGTIIANGSRTGTTNSVKTISDDFVLPSGTYILSSNDGASTSDLRLQVLNVTQGTVAAEGNNSSFTSNGTDTLRLRMWLRSTVATVSNLKFYPMIRLASDPDDTYVPYAMTNKELTDLAQQEIGNYMYKGSYSVSVVADGTKDYETLINETATAMLTALQALASDEVAFIKQASVNGTTVPIINKLSAEFKNNATSFDIDYAKTTISVGTGVDILWGRFNTTKSGVRCASESLTAGAAIPTPTDLRSNVPSSSGQFNIYYQVYKKIS